MPSVPSDFSFLTTDIRRQREIAQEALDEAKRIDAIIDKTTDATVKEELKKTKERLLKITRGLVDNVTHTSTAATVTLTGTPATVTFTGTGGLSADVAVKR
jgi:hypothetical protein